VADTSRTSEQRLDGVDRDPLHTDAELMCRWLRAQRPVTKHGGTVLWFKVSEEFCIGSTSAQDVCRRHGFDPDSRVART